MDSYIDMVTKSPVMWQKGDIVVYDMSGRYHMVKAGKEVATLIYGGPGLVRSYKGSFDNWVQAIKQKDLAKVERMRKQAMEQSNAASELEELWR